MAKKLSNKVTTDTDPPPKLNMDSNISPKDINHSEYSSNNKSV